jgi:putative DNA primase/helicase
MPYLEKLFAIGNEVVASREDLYHVKGNIKHMVTERRWVVEGKHKDQRWERNCCNFVFMSNEINPQALDSGDRRHLVIWTPPVPGSTKRPG